jgi:hypothetical protein
MKTKISLLLLSALFASFAFVSCKEKIDEVLRFEGEWPGFPPTGRFAISITGSAFNNDSAIAPGYVKAFVKIDGEEVGINSATPGDEVWLRANPYTGFEFLEWITFSDVTLSDTEASETSFIMPAFNVSFEGSFDDLSHPLPTPYELEKVIIPAHKALPENVALRAWKARQVRQVWGWYDSWGGKKMEGPNSMRGLPKEVSLIANWGGPKTNMSDWQKADQKYVQEVYGTKFLVTFFSAHVGDDIDGWDKAKTQTVGSSTDDATIRPIIAEYARAIYDMCLSEGYDGYDWDYEPSVSGQGSGAPLWYLKEQAATFLEELAYYFGTDAKNPSRDRNANGLGKLRGEMPKKDLLLVVDGEVHNSYFSRLTEMSLATAYVNYYVQQAYGNVDPGGRVGGIIGAVQKHIDNKTELPEFTLQEAASRCIVAEDWEGSQGKGGGNVFKSAVYMHQGFDIGGFGAYRIGLGYTTTDVPYKGSLEYINLRKAIDLQYGEGPRELQ